VSARGAESGPELLTGPGQQREERRATIATSSPDEKKSLARWVTARKLGSLRHVGRCDYIVITMKARLIRIGNSRGVRLPKAVIDQVGLDDDIELRVEQNRVIITASAPPRSGWADAAKRLAAESRELLDSPLPTRFDEDEWQW
jgi:antitoxin MazE